MERFRSSSELGSNFCFDRESVEWVDRFIENERKRPQITPHEHRKLATLLGAYLGEAVIHKYGGHWKEYSGNWGIFFDDANAVFPFVKVLKQFENGSEGGASILSFFDLVGLVILHRAE
jgi:hypothetical protein